MRKRHDRGARRHGAPDQGTGAYRGHRLVARFSGPLTDGIHAFSYTGTYR